MIVHINPCAKIHRNFPAPFICLIMNQKQSVKNVRAKPKNRRYILIRIPAAQLAGKPDISQEYRISHRDNRKNTGSLLVQELSSLRYKAYAKNIRKRLQHPLPMPLRYSDVFTSQLYHMKLPHWMFGYV